MALGAMRERLRFLYGDRLGDQTYAELQRLLAEFGAPVSSGTSSRSPFHQSDVILISYGDSVLSNELRPLAALRAFAERHLQDLVSTIHILPFFPYSSDYGFSVVDYLQVDPELGNWGDIATLHARFKLMFDFVLNHVSAGSAWFAKFLRGDSPYDEYFITVDPRTDLSSVTRPRTSPLLTRYQTSRGERHVWTTFSSDQVDLNYANPRALLQMIEVMLRYVERGADLLRMDAVGYLWKEVGTSCIHLPQTHEVVKLLRDILDEVAPQVAIVTETNVPHRDNVSYFGDGYDEAQLVYQFPLAPLVFDAFARRDAGQLTTWAAALEIPSESATFFNFLASHDGIGLVPARGILNDSQIANLVQRTFAHGGQVSYKTDPDGRESPYELNATFFDALSDPRDEREGWPTKLDRFICSQAIMLALAGVPGIYIHSLLGSHNDYVGYARSGWKRDLNHERLGLDHVERRLADPADEASQVFARYARLLATRAAQPAFDPGSPQQVLEVGGQVFALRRGPRGGQTIHALHSVSEEPQVVDLGQLGEPHSAELEDLIGGRRVAADGLLDLAPYEVVWLA